MLLAGTALRAPKRTLASALIASLAAGSANPAAGQVSGAVSIESDFRLRGYSMSAGQPVASARVGFDHESGVYAESSATVVATRDDGVRFLGFQVGAGVARRVGERWAIDLGVAHNELRAAYPGAPSYDYSEGYFGVTHSPFSAYVFVSPNYFRPGFKTVYGQVEVTVSPAEHWHLTAHAGSLSYLDTPYEYEIEDKTYYDWRVGLTREFGNVEVHAAVSGGGPGRQYYYGEPHSRTAVTAGASVSF